MHGLLHLAYLHSSHHLEYILISVLLLSSKKLRQIKESSIVTRDPVLTVQVVSLAQFSTVLQALHFPRRSWPSGKRSQDDDD